MQLQKCNTIILRRWYNKKAALYCREVLQMIVLNKTILEVLKLALLLLIAHESVNEVSLYSFSQ